MIHSVIFSFKSGLSSKHLASFFDAASELQKIDGVKDFTLLKQISSKNRFDYGISMRFDTVDDFEAYNSHSLHQSFITDYWLTTVEHFLEIDFEPFSPDAINNPIS